MMGGMGGGCCISFNDLGAESALADFGTESDFLTWKPSQIFVLIINDLA